MSGVAAAPEADVSAALREHLDRLTSEGRCIYRPEVWLGVWTHALRGQMDRLRIDYVMSLDGGPLIGVEVKRRPDSEADLGRHMRQCSHYAAGIIAVQAADRIVPAWLGQPLMAVFLRVDQRGMDEAVQQSAKAAVRLFGPSNVGFAYVTKRNGVNLNIGGDRWWCERYGYRANAMDRTFRIGNGNWKPEA